ncbi:DUF1168 domain protein [Penicillium chermesinum]|uniref:DUF1168 domain protein n=1 Tax=Penicillium chermesinum TaxID=63820 RepID=A0A9W9TUI4_9EURO|nr:DUF1168 domain protein [Penicillium chermesinum]KAJ5240009.1 DUF1168 domain protein [Penicillium chermesinum]
MSEPGPESIPTSANPRNQRPNKRRALDRYGEQAAEIENLFKDPSKEIQFPSAKKRATGLPPPPEIVPNVQGSSAGAGSGEFHVYKASRRREEERLAMMQAEVEKAENDAKWQKERDEIKRKEEEKTAKNRRRREKRRAGANKKNSAANVGETDQASKPSVAPRRPMGGTEGSGDEHAQKDEAQNEEARQEEARQEEAQGLIIHDDD